MSGPKVVKIVTREEVQAICRGHLRALEVAIGQFRTRAEKHDVWNDTLEQAATAWRKEFAEIYDRDRFMDIQKKMPVQIEFIRSETARITQAAIGRATAKREKRRQIANAARSLAGALRATGRPVPDATRLALEKASNIGILELPNIEAELNAAFAILRASDQAGSNSDVQKDLAKRLAVGETGQTFAEWTAKQESKSDPADARIERLMAEIDTLANQTAAQSFGKRAAEIFDERSADRKALLTDSLSLDISEHLNELRVWQRLLSSLLEAVASLEQLGGSETDQPLSQAKIAIENEDIELAEKTIAMAQVILNAAAVQKASVARRKAILDGLSALGYEVQENMATAWAKSGRIIVRKPGSTDYGVELGAAPEAESMQVRLVGAANPKEARTTARDRDAETSWCTDFDRLRQSLAAHGEDLKLERALPIGAQPVKDCIFENSESQIAIDPRRHGKGFARSLD